MSSHGHSKIALAIVKEYPLSQISNLLEVFMKGPSVANGDACGNGCGNGCGRTIDQYDLLGITQREMAAARGDERGLRTAIAEEVMQQIKRLREAA